MGRLATASAASSRDPFHLEQQAVANCSLKEMTVFVVLSNWDAERDKMCRELARGSDDVRLFLPDSRARHAPRQIARVVVPNAVTNSAAVPRAIPSPHFDARAGVAEET